MLHSCDHRTYGVSFIVDTPCDVANRKTPAFRDGDDIVDTFAFCDVANRVAKRKSRRKSLFIVDTPRRAINRVANRESQIASL